MWLSYHFSSLVGPEFIYSSSNLLSAHYFCLFPGSTLTDNNSHKETLVLVGHHTQRNHHTYRNIARQSDPWLMYQRQQFKGAEIYFGSAFLIDTHPLNSFIISYDRDTGLYSWPGLSFFRFNGWVSLLGWLYLVQIHRKTEAS